MASLTRKTVRMEEEISEVDLQGPVHQVIDHIQTISENRTNPRIMFRWEDYETLCIYLCYDRPETDREFNDRQKREEKIKIANAKKKEKAKEKKRLEEQAERQLYEELKKKYDNA